MTHLEVTVTLSNGNSFGNGPGIDTKGSSTEPWYIRVLLAPVQDRGPV